MIYELHGGLHGLYDSPKVISGALSQHALHAERLR